MQKLGRIRPVYSGEWNSGKAYTALEMVGTPDGGLSYIAQKDVPAGMPLTNGEYWAVVLDVREVLEAVENAADRINNVMDVKANALAATVAGNPVQIYPDEHSIIKPVLTLLPVQSGSGDPYPAGGGKNLLEYPYETTVMESNGISFGYSSDGRVSIKGTASANVAFILRPYVAGKRTELKAGTYTFSGNPSNAFRVLLYVYGSQDAATEERVHGINGGGSVTFTVDSTKYYGAYAWIDSGTTVDTTIAPQLEKGSIASAFAPYSNIRPITGRTGTELVRCKKNLLNLSGAYVNGWNITNIPNGLKPNRQYVFSVVKSGGISFAVYAMTGLSAGESEKTVKLTESYYNEGGSATFIAPDDICDYNYIVLAGSASGIAGVFPDVKFQLELSSTASAFEPYQGDTYALDFGQTVYGGKVDWSKGEMVVDWAKVTLPSSANWAKSTSAKNGYYLGDGNVFVPQKLYMCPVLCNVAKYTSDVEEYKANYGMVYSDSTISLNVDPAVCGNTLASFKAWLDSTEVQIAYKLANPIAIQLTPQQITALTGINTVYGDADGMTVGYNKSLNAAFEELKNAILTMGGNV